MEIEEIVKEVRRFNNSLEDLVEVAQDFNQFIYKYFGGKAKYKKREKEG